MLAMLIRFRPCCLDWRLVSSRYSLTQVKNAGSSWLAALSFAACAFWVVSSVMVVLRVGRLLSRMENQKSRIASRESELDVFAGGDGVHVLVAATGEVAKHDRVLRQVARELGC